MSDDVFLSPDAHAPTEQWLAPRLNAPGVPRLPHTQAAMVAFAQALGRADSALAASSDAHARQLARTLEAHRAADAENSGRLGAVRW